MSIRPDYLAQFPPMRRGKVAATLDRLHGLNGEVMPRWQIAEKLAQNPGLRLDEARGRLYRDDDGVFFDISALTRSVVDYAVWLHGRPKVPA